jgi:hypothetical protein
MADTSLLKPVSEYAVDEVSKKLNIKLARQKVKIGFNKEKTFDGVSIDGDIVIKVLNHSGLTSGGNIPSAKIRSTYADCYFLSLTKARKKVLVLTNKEFYDIFNHDSIGLLNDIELMYIELSDKYKAITSEVSKLASDEMS